MLWFNFIILGANVKTEICCFIICSLYFSFMVNNLSSKMTGYCGYLQVNKVHSYLSVCILFTCNNGKCTQ